MIGPDNVETIEHFVLQPSDKSQSVSILTKDDIRYIINGIHTTLPDSNYVKVDISEIDPIGDEIGVCWNNGRYRWELVNHGSRILENKLDTTQFKFNTSWELDEGGIPDASKYHQKGCGSTGTYYFSPLEGDNLESYPTAHTF